MQWSKPGTGFRVRGLAFLLLMAVPAACKQDATAPPDAPAQCEVTAVAISPAQATVEVGKTVTLAASISQRNCSDLQIAWTSSDATLAQVTDGVVAGLAVGAVTITATVNNVTGAAAVQVTPPPPLVVNWEFFRYVALGQGEPPFAGEVYALTGTSATDLYASAGHRVHHYDGTRWTMIRQSGSEVRGLWAAGPGDLFLAEGTGVARWSGGTWVSENTASHMRGIWGADAGAVFAVGRSGTILHFDGSAWSPQTSGTTQDLESVFGFAANDVYAVGNGGTILHYDGAKWTNMQSGTSASLLAVWGSGAASVFVSGQGVLLRYDGNTWTSLQLPAGTISSLYGLWGTGPTDVHIVGTNATALRFDGVMVQPTPVNTTTSIWAVWGTRTGLFAGGGNTTLRFVNGQWEKLSYVPDLRGVYVFDSSHALAVGDEGTILRFNGSTWVPENSGTNARLYGVSAAGMGEIWVVGALPPTAQAFALRSDGQSWQPVTLPPGTFASLYSVWVVGPGQVTVGGSGGNALRLAGGAWVYENVGHMESLRGLWGTAANDVFAACDNGRITHFDGNSWNGQASGTTERLYAIWGRAADDIWAVGQNGAVVHNDGSGWTFLRQLGTLPLTGVWGLDTRDVFITGYNGAVHHFNGTDWGPARLDDVDRKLNAIHGAGGSIVAVGQGGSIWVGR